MFYSKYRPQKFSDIIDSSNVVASLLSQISKQKTAHAYLFVGPRGTGKTTTARVLAKALNCLNPLKNGDCCDKCENCVSITKGNFIDLLEIDAASNRGIDDIRSLREKVKLASSGGKFKIYLIDEVHMLTNEAFNALLKTLEEPPAHVKFILCTTEIHKVPETIKSRCQVFSFKRGSLIQIVEKLQLIATKEKSKISKDSLIKIAQAAFGGYRDAETLLEQVIDGELNIEDFGFDLLKINYQFVNNLYIKNTAECLQIVNNVFTSGVDLGFWSNNLVKYCRDLIFISSNAPLQILDLTEDVLAIMQEQVKLVDIVSLVKIIQLFSEATEKVNTSFIPQLPLEIAILKFCNDSLNTNDTSPNAPKVGGPSNAANLPFVESIINNTNILDEDNFDVNLPDEIFKTLKATSQNDLQQQQEIKHKVVNNLNIQVSDLLAKWNEVVSTVVGHKSSVKALLKATKPIEIDDTSVVLEVCYKFHKERIESESTKVLIEDAIKQVFNVKARIKCLVNETLKPSKENTEGQDLTDHNLVLPKDQLVNVFDGGLPL